MAGFSFILYQRDKLGHDVLFAEVEDRLLHDDVMQLVERRVRESIDEHNRSLCRVGASDLGHRLREVEAKLDRIVDSIADYGGNERLYSKLSALEEERSALLQDSESAKAAVDARIDVTRVLPQLFAEWREFIAGLRSISTHICVKPEEVQWARQRLHDLLGDVVVQPRDGVLWAHIGLNAKGLAEARPLTANINRDFLVAGAGFRPLRFALRLVLRPLPTLARRGRCG